MGEKEEKKKNKKQKHIHPNDQTPNKPTSSDYSFNPTSAVKGLKFGAQFIIKSFTVRRALPPELLHLLHHPPPNYDHNHNKPTHKIFPSTTGYLPTNFTILAHHAWHTLTLGLGTKKSKVILFVFESEGLKSNVDRIWPSEISLGEVNKKMIRGLKGCEMARFKFRKGCVTFYVYAVRRIGSIGFKCGEDLRRILDSKSHSLFLEFVSALFRCLEALSVKTEDLLCVECVYSSNAFECYGSFFSAVLISNS
ncbi:hypothetical protein LguiA_034960 [Lonicera macranthoides]